MAKRCIGLGFEFCVAALQGSQIPTPLTEGSDAGQTLLLL